MNATNKVNRLRRTALIVVRLGLIVSLWQAPIPWLHSHGTDIAQIAPATNATELATHLAIFHDDVAPGSEHDFGWHWHWVLPSWSHALDDTPDDERPSEEAVAFDTSTAAPSKSLLVPNRFIVELTPGHTQRSAKVFGCALRNPDNHADRLLRRDAFTVMRC
jgi:hypothetical protein